MSHEHEPSEARDTRSVVPNGYQHAAEVLIAECDGLARLGRYDEALAHFDSVVEQFGETDDPGLGRLVRVTLARRAQRS
jgi:hypothetical protein